MVCAGTPAIAQTFVAEIVDNDIGRIGPTGLAIDVVAGVTYLYAVDNVGGRVIKYNAATGARVAFWGGVGEANGQLNSPYGIAVDPVSHDVYVAERLNHRVSRFTSTGTFVMRIGGGGAGSAAGQFSGPIGVAADAAGNVYVVDHNNNRVQKFNVQGTTATFVGAFGMTGAGAAQFNAPYGITLDASGVLWVADAGNRRLQRFDANGNFLSVVGNPGQFNTPTWVSFDAAGNYYVCETNTDPQNGAAPDIQNQRISKFSPNGTLLVSWGTLGEAGGQFKLPFTMAIDAAGNAFVSDYYNTRIQKFNLNATLAASLPQINSRLTANATAGTAFLYNTFALAQPAPVSFSASGLPPGYVINATSGAISGNTSTSGIYAVTLGATNSVGTGSATLNLTVAGPAGSPVITSPTSASSMVGTPFSYSITATNAPTSFTAAGLAPGLTFNAATGVISGTPTTPGTYNLTISAGNASGSNTAAVSLSVAANTSGAPGSIVGSGMVAQGGTATFNAPVTANTSYQWNHNGVPLAGATATSYTVTNVQPVNAGIYTVVMVTGATGTTQGFVLGLGVPPTGSKVVGAGSEVGSDIRHANGNVYDQVLLQGTAATIRADAGQVTRISYIDLNDDIVQVEFAGAGSLSINLELASGPAAPSKYNQPTVQYMRGHAHLAVVGADSTTNVSVFSVGRGNAVNQALFRSDVTYDGLADISVIGLHSAGGGFGGVRTANAIYQNSRGLIGVFAQGVNMGLMFVGNIKAFNTGIPVMLTNSSGDSRLTGGDLAQANGRGVDITGIAQLRFVDGSTSHSVILPAQPCRGVLLENGVDVTARVASGP